MPKGNKFIALTLYLEKCGKPRIEHTKALFKILQ